MFKLLSGGLHFILAGICGGVQPDTQQVLSPPHKLQQSNPLVQSCSQDLSVHFPSIVCIKNRGAVIQGDFKRPVRNVLGDADKFRDTSAPSEPSFHHVAQADFVVWDQERAPELLGSNPSVEFMFKLPYESHEGPVWSPLTNELYFTKVKSGFLGFLAINLTVDPPTLRHIVPSPPIYAPTGSRYRDGLVYFSTIGGNSDLEGYSFHPGIYTYNVTSGESATLLNNYHGYYFNGADDFDIDQNGNIWVTDNYYGRPCHVNTEPPQINAATYRFNPHTGSIVIVEDSLQEPNGVAFAPDFKTLYLTDTGSGNASIDPGLPAHLVPHIKYNTTGPRTIYAYDIDERGTGLRNKRPIHLALDYVPDGIKVSREGYIVTGAGYGVSVLSPEGELLVVVQTNFTVINIAFVGEEAEELWAVGIGGIARVRWGIRGFKDWES
ncbi:putative gluconolactonase precursor [Lophiotrema nucula]|uniref:Putative gluconolactonase n=1 Tax=Lophiotrema nucula TaxID=690887 RepID=A0A6A5YKW6_9PLEO|nr:putative gluconolactonase precursor [Lophiotrema nucula]